MANPCLSSLLCISDNINEASQEIPGLFPACTVIHALAKQAEKQLELLDDPAKSHVVDLSDTFLAHSDLHDNYVDEPERDVERKNSYPTKQLIECQQSDPELIPLLQGALCESEAAKIATCFYMQSGILIYMWRPPTISPDEEWQVSHQVVVPKCYHEDVSSLAHKLRLAGHLGFNKTYQKVLSHFYWLDLHRDVVKFCRACHTCQMVGKPNQKSL